MDIDGDSEISESDLYWSLKLQFTNLTMEKIKEMISNPDVEDDTIGDHLIVNRS